VKARIVFLAIVLAAAMSVILADGIWPDLH
jgi:hypothetical protein